MRPDIAVALAVDASSTMAARTIDITTVGRHSSLPRRIEIVFYRIDNDIYLSGLPSPRTRDWLSNLSAHASLIFHLKHDVVADLPASATIITDPAERRRILAVIVDDFNSRHDVDSPWPKAILDEWVENSPLAKITFSETD